MVISASSVVQTKAPRTGQPAGAWFCVRTHNKHEHVAAAHLRQEPDIEVFLPRIRYRRPTRFGSVWTTEALFQTYLFASFDFETRLRQVQHARAVRGVVHFGTRWPVIPNSVVEGLRQALGEQEMAVVSDELEIGETVQVAGGPLQGLEAVVTRVMPGPQRVALLLDFLGRQTAVELSRDQVVRRELRLFSACLACP
jgi:transcriptional antiterminator RfaH